MDMRRSRLPALAALAAGAALAATAGAGPGTAASSVVVSGLQAKLASVTAGQTAGFHVDVANAGTSTVNHVVLRLWTGLAGSDPADGATFASAAVSGVSAAEVTCSAGTDFDMLCTVDQLATGQGFSVDAAFTAPGLADGVAPQTLEGRAQVTVDAQTTSTGGSSGTSTWPATPDVVTTTVQPATSTDVRTWALASDTTTLPGNVLHASVTMPASFLNELVGVPTEAAESSFAAQCNRCPTTALSLLLEHSTDPDASPFSPANPFAFALRLDAAGQPPGYKPRGVFHVVDGVPQQVPSCGSSPAAALADPANLAKMCLDGPLAKEKRSGILTARGFGTENGFIGFD
jgi:hypothetical protein